MNVRFRPIADIPKAWNAATVRGMASAAALALLAGCGGPEQSEQDAAEWDMVPVPPSQPQPEPAPVAWDCEAPRFESFGNKWWAQFTACQGDVAIDVAADSVLLGGPDVRLTVRTPACPTGTAATYAGFEREMFDRPFETQLAEIKRIARQSLAQIDEACGGPANAPALLGPQFDEKFLDLARSKWLDLSAEHRRRSWKS